MSLLDGQDKNRAYMALRDPVSDFCRENSALCELDHYSRILSNNIADFPQYSIRSSAYVVHTLEAALWCVMRNDNYSETVLQAVNLGEDTDTVAALAGGLAGMIYGDDQIPKEWTDVLARKEDILDLADRFSKAILH